MWYSRFFLFIILFGIFLVVFLVILLVVFLVIFLIFFFVVLFGFLCLAIFFTVNVQKGWKEAGEVNIEILVIQ